MGDLAGHKAAESAQNLNEVTAIGLLLGEAARVALGMKVPGMHPIQNLVQPRHAQSWQSQVRHPQSRSVHKKNAL